MNYMKEERSFIMENKLYIILDINDLNEVCFVCVAQEVERVVH